MFTKSATISKTYIEQKPVQIFKNLENHIERIALILIVTVLSMIAYLVLISCSYKQPHK